ncbi:MAG: hypothetical protein CBC35_02380 [Planctomycetes bacterium TMED75]|nr:hypothetical protein [Planctomycetaceae bacterium]OUU95845.1 MAG: hypothetical protein CBC35_02380 [Planctomycetes bacterium TMED75]
MPQRSVHFFTLGADRSRQAWGAVGAMPAWKRTLMLVGLLLVSLPLFLLMLLLGALLLAMAATALVFSIIANWFRTGGSNRATGRSAARANSMRENVRVIGEHQRR